MENTFYSFVKEKKFKIPDYQRAYSWGETQIELFVNDLVEHSMNEGTYYLGHFILENSNKEFEIIDGQQRITTVYLFLLVCNYLQNKSDKTIHLTPVSFDVEGLKKIEQILENKDKIDENLENLLKDTTTMSMKRMVKAVQLFIENFADKPLDKDKIDTYKTIINKANCSFALFEDKSVAAQIFELHNTRGVALTETEKVKSLIMKSIYINSVNKEDDIKEIQNEFSKIFKMEEKISEVWLRGNMPLDTMLMYHLRAVDDGKKGEAEDDSFFCFPSSETGYDGCFEYVKERLDKKRSEEKSQAVEYAKNLACEFAKTMNILVETIPQADGKNHLIGDVLLLDKDRSMIFLLRAFRVGNPIKNNLIARWENFLLCYELISSHGYYHNKRGHRDRFEEIYESILLNHNASLKNCNKLLSEYYKCEKNFSYYWEHLGINAKKRFTEDVEYWQKEVGAPPVWKNVSYFLYKYEIANGGNIKKIRKEIFKTNSVSIDHIVARGTEWKELGLAKKLIKNIEEVIDGIGNLALSNRSDNSSASNDKPEAHLRSYKDNGLEKTYEQVACWKDPKKYADKISKRSEDIIKFIKKIANYDEIWK